MLFERDDFKDRVAESGLSYGEYARRQVKERQRRVYADPWGRGKDYLKRFQEAEAARKEEARQPQGRREMFRRSWENMVLLAMRRAFEVELGIEPPQPRILVQHIILKTAKKYKVHPQDITGRTCRRFVVQARQEVFWLARRQTPKSLPEIAHIVGRMDHTTVLHGIRNYERLRRVKAGLEAPKNLADFNRPWSLIIDGEGI